MGPKKPSQRSSIFPSASSALESLRTPGYQRTLILRRVLAGALAIIAMLSFATSTFSRDPSVVTFAAPVEVGTVLSEHDVRLTQVPEHLVPKDAVTLIDDAVGKVAATHGTEGQFLTSVQLLGEEYSAAYVTHITEEFDAGSHSMVPIKLAEPDIIPLLHQGDVVNIVSTNSHNGTSDTIATGGRVVFAGETGTTNAETVLVLLPEAMANAVAAASLTSPLTVILTGSRAKN
ncbi:SAF domain-containing protein [Corynebacterium sp. S7]